MQQPELAIELRALSKTFGQHRALREVDLTIPQGQMVALLGSSGAGKSTLLRHLSGLVASDSVAPSGRIPEVFVLGERIQRAGKLSPRVRACRTRIGFIFQQFNLVGRLPLLTNVLIGKLHTMALVRRLAGWFNAQERREAMAALHAVGMARHAAQRASTLSGGQQQRAAIARALVQGARVLLADEPIASLDPRSAHQVMAALRDVNRQRQTTVVVSVHQVEFARQYCDRVIAIKDGKVACDCAAGELSDAELVAIYGARDLGRESSGQPAAPPTIADSRLLSEAGECEP